MGMMLNQGVRRSVFFTQSFWLVVVLWLSVIASALAVIYVTYDTRVKFNTLEGLRREQGQLRVVWGQYLLEESTWASYGRVEKLAQEQLSMQVPESENVITVTPDEIWNAMKDTLL
jgi:cell division protein FtsL